MIKKNRVRKDKDFELILSKHHQIRNRYYSIYFLENKLGYSRFGISVSKKLGNAVIRNKIKRQIRSIIANDIKYDVSNDYVIIVKKDYNVSLFNEIKKDLIKDLKEKQNKDGKKEII